MDAERAARRSVLARLEGHTLGTTALRVLDDAAITRARMSLPANRTIRHLVLAVNVGVVAGRDVVGVRRHVVVAGAGHLRMLVQVSRNALGLERTLAQGVPLAWGVSASEAREVVAAIRAEGAFVQTAPIVATALVRRTFVVGVEWVGVMLSTDGPALR